MKEAQNQKLVQYLNEFKDEADGYYEKALKHIKPFYDFFKNFFKEENLQKAEWNDFQEMGKQIHSFNSMQLAYKKALGKPNHKIEHYRNTFHYIAYGEDPVNIKLNNIVNNTKGYELRNFGNSALSELFGHAYSDKYVFFNKRDQDAANFLDIHPVYSKGDKFGDKYLKFNDAIRPVFDQYLHIVGKRTMLPLAMEIDQFFNWLYETHIINKSKNSPQPPDEPDMNGVNEEKPDNIRYWLFAPGRNAMYWNQYYENSEIAIGPNELYDYKKYSSSVEIEKVLQKIYKTKSRKMNDALGAYEFASVMKPGDIVIAKKGTTTYLGYGVVDSDYFYDNSRSDYHHVRKVKWIKKGEWKDKNIVVKTLTDITKYPEYVKKLNKLLDINLNIKRSYWWLNANPKHWDIESMSIGDEQNYTTINPDKNKRRVYEYFKQVRPGDLIIGYKTTPVKRIKAVLEITQGLHIDDDEGEVITFKLKELVKNDITWDKLNSLSELQQCEVLRNNQGSLFKLTESEYNTIYNLCNNNLIIDSVPPYTINDASKDLFIKNEEIENIIQLLDYKKNIVLQGPPGTGKTYIAKKIAYLKMGKKDEDKILQIQFHQSYSYEDFIQGYRPSENSGFNLKNGVFYLFCEKARKDPDNDYFFIIDEINRGNLSKIFGELMMLIEKDKRGVEFSIPLTYSRSHMEIFFIPDNVYLIGTMNTADRSLAIVDYALRRRFSFIDITPKYDQKFIDFLVKNGVQNTLAKRISDKMIALNKVISEDSNLGKWYTLGHSYFCNFSKNSDLNWFNNIVNKEIGPLLKEYWFDNTNTAEKQIETLLQE